MKTLLVAFAMFVFVAIPLHAEEIPPVHSKHMSDSAFAAGSTPKEPGQSAFAAIQEIVVLLEASSETNWSTVDIEALRQHLIDMDNVTLRASVEGKATGAAMDYVITGEGPVIASVQRMVMAHTKTMNGVEGWSFEAVQTAAGAQLRVTPPMPADLQKLKALGFIGVMARGMHHQEHHWMIATGKLPHH